jgi:hypothetical protein
MSEVITVLTEIQVSSLLTPVPSLAPNNTFDITVHDTQFNRVITYTTNGLEPTLNSQKYTQPITISNEDSSIVTLKILFYNHITKTCEYYSGDYVFEAIVDSTTLCDIESILNIPLTSQDVNGIESVITSLPVVSYINVPSESILNPIDVILSVDIESVMGSLSIVYSEPIPDIQSRLTTPIETLNIEVESALNTLTNITVELIQAIESKYTYPITGTPTNDIESNFANLITIMSDTSCYLESRLEYPLETLTEQFITSAYTGLPRLTVVNKLYITSNLTDPIYAVHYGDIESHLGETIRLIDYDNACSIESELTPFEIPQIPFDTWITEDGMFVIVDEVSPVNVGNSIVDDNLIDLIFEGTV